MTRHPILDALLGPLGTALDDELGDVLDDAISDVPPIAPSHAGRARLRDALRAAPLAPFVPVLATLFEIGRDAAATILATVDGWETLAPGVSVLHVKGGPALDGLDVGLVRLDAGAAVPSHLHVGDERVLVLIGRLEDELGHVAAVGSRMDMPAGTRHTPRAVGGPAMFAVVAGGVDFGDVEPT